METGVTPEARARVQQCHSWYARLVYAVLSGIGLAIASLDAANPRGTGRVPFLAFGTFFLYVLIRAIRTGATFYAGVPPRLTYRGLLTTRTWTPEQVTVIEFRGTDGVGCPTVVLTNKRVRLRGLTASEAFAQDPQAQFLAMASEHDFKTSLGPTIS